MGGGHVDSLCLLRCVWVEIIFAAHKNNNRNKKEHVATGELRQLLASETPLSELLATARGVNKELQQEGQHDITTVEGRTKEVHQHLQYVTARGSTHTLQPYSEFTSDLTAKCHLIMDARRESLRILVNNIHKKHRSTLLMNVEDLFANWFDVPLGLLVDDPSADAYSPKKVMS